MQTCAFEAHREVVLRAPGCEVGFWCHLMGRPKLQETCVLSVITSVRVQAVVTLQVGNSASSILKLLRYVGCDVI